MDPIVSRSVVDPIYFGFAKAFIVFLMKDCSVNPRHTVSVVRFWNGLKIS